MYKAKIKIWCFLLALSLIIYNLNGIKSYVSSLVSSLVASNVYNAYVCVDAYPFLSYIDTYSNDGAKIKITINKELADILIYNASDKEIKNFTKYEKQFYSPIMMFVPTSAMNDDSGFLEINIKNARSTTYIQKDLKIILEAIENEKTYPEIGIKDKSLGEGLVKLAIPNENGEFYDEIKELMTLTLCDYDYDNINEDITKRIDNIIEKCDKYENATQYMLNIINNWKQEDKVILLAPEYICINDDNINNLNTNKYICCVPLKTINCYLDLYLSNNNNIDYYNRLLNSLTKRKFLDRTGFRNKEIDFDIYSSNNFFLNPNVIPSLN